MGCWKIGSQAPPPPLSPIFSPPCLRSSQTFRRPSGWPSSTASTSGYGWRRSGGPWGVAPTTATTIQCPGPRAPGHAPASLRRSQRKPHPSWPRRGPWAGQQEEAGTAGEAKKMAEAGYSGWVCTTSFLCLLPPLPLPPALTPTYACHHYFCLCPHPPPPRTLVPALPPALALASLPRPHPIQASASCVERYGPNTSGTQGLHDLSSTSEEMDSSPHVRGCRRWMMFRLLLKGGSEAKKKFVYLQSASNFRLLQ